MNLLKEIGRKRFYISFIERKGSEIPPQQDEILRKQLKIAFKKPPDETTDSCSEQSWGPILLIDLLLLLIFKL